MDKIVQICSSVVCNRKLCTFVEFNMNKADFIHHNVANGTWMYCSFLSTSEQTRSLMNHRTKLGKELQSIDRLPILCLL